MVNHFYTLLTNLPGEYVPYGTGVKEVYTPLYTPRTVPDNIKYVEYALFGDCVDMGAQRTKAYALTTLVGLSELKHVLLEHDTRVTYEKLLNFPQVNCDASLVFTLEIMSSFPDSVWDTLFGEHKDLREVYSFGTCVDRIVAVVCAYVRIMDGVE